MTAVHRNLHVTTREWNLSPLLCLEESLAHAIAMQSCRLLLIVGCDFNLWSQRPILAATVTTTILSVSERHEQVGTLLYYMLKHNKYRATRCMLHICALSCWFSSYLLGILPNFRQAQHILQRQPA